MENVKNDEKMTFTQHLKEFKTRLIVMVAVFLAGFVLCYIFAPEIVTFMININRNYTFVQSDVTELLAQYIKVSLIAALVLDSPIIVWQVHSFVSPGLTKSEDAKFLAILVGGLFFFALGDLFCYTIVIPFTLQFFYGLNVNLAATAAINSLIDLQKYISYLIALLLSFGCIFEMPVIAAIMASLGLINPKGMRSARSIVIVVCFLVGAAITPPDIVSQCMVALPMLLLYQVSIWICAIVSRHRRKKMIAEGIDPDEEETPGEEKTSRWQQALMQVEKKDAQKRTQKKE